MSDPDLSSLRDSIAEVDRALLELLRRRMELSAEVGRIKAAAGSPVEVRDSSMRRRSSSRRAHGAVRGSGANQGCRRMELSAEVGRIKAAAGSPVEVRDVERIVLDRARKHADACGVSEDVMMSMFQAIIRGSVERQRSEERRVGREGRAQSTAARRR